MTVSEKVLHPTQPHGKPWNKGMAKENLMVGTHNGQNETFDKHYDTIRWDKPTPYQKLLAKWEREEVIENKKIKIKRKSTRKEE